ncbi:MAG: DUF3145 domain-containing protein [Actinomycetes bacterium]
MTAASSTSRARGVVFVHSVSPAVAPHVEFALTHVLGSPVSLEWTAQPVVPRALRAELSWQGRPMTAARLTSALRTLEKVLFEVTEDASLGGEGERYSYTPSLGVFHALVGTHGDILLPEDRVRAAVVRAQAGECQLDTELDRLLGKPWDDELEAYRHAGEGAPVRWLHAVV